jgi:hypothetical protein
VTVGFEAQTASSTFTTTSPFNFNHAGIAPKGLVVGVDMITAAGNVSAITYGGVSVPIILNKNSGNVQSEDGRALIAFLGSGIPVGTKQVSVTNNGLGTQCQVCVVTLTAGNDTEIGDSEFLTGVVQSPSVVLATANQALRIGALYTGFGQVANVVIGSGMTVIGNHSNGFRTSRHDRQTTPSSGSFTFGYTTGVAAEVALVVLAIQEAQSHHGGGGAVRRHPTMR